MKDYKITDLWTGQSWLVSLAPTALIQEVLATPAMLRVADIPLEPAIERLRIEIVARQLEGRL